MGLEEADDMNVPVCIFISEPCESETAWTLSANNYMPRRNFIAEGMYEYHSDSKEELLALVQKYIVPLYETALRRLKTDGNLYYWQEKK
jgi:hypothetical protein